MGYKIGDKFEITDGKPFSKGSVVCLYEDDGSEIPLFRLISGNCLYDNCEGKAGAYEYLSNVKPI